MKKMPKNFICDKCKIEIKLRNAIIEESKIIHGASIIKCPKCLYDIGLYSTFRINLVK